MINELLAASGSFNQESVPEYTQSTQVSSGPTDRSSPIPNLAEAGLEAGSSSGSSSGSEALI